MTRSRLINLFSASAFHIIINKQQNVLKKYRREIKFQCDLKYKPLVTEMSNKKGLKNQLDNNIRKVYISKSIKVNYNFIEIVYLIGANFEIG